MSTFEDYTPDQLYRVEMASELFAHAMVKYGVALCHPQQGKENDIMSMVIPIELLYGSFNGRIH